MKCDACGREIKSKAWLSWFMRRERKLRFICYALTHHPVDCIEQEPNYQGSEHAFARSASFNGHLIYKDDRLFDHFALDIAIRFIDWAKEYEVPGDVVAEIAVRIAPLLIGSGNAKAVVGEHIEKDGTQ